MEPYGRRGGLPDTAAVRMTPRPGRESPIQALRLGWRNTVRLGRDYYVRVDTNDYSVDPRAVGRLVDVAADLDRVRVRADGRLIAEHARVWARGMTITDSAHLETVKLLREQFRASRSAAAGDDLVRDLADYDRAFGIGGGF